MKLGEVISRIDWVRKKCPDTQWKYDRVTGTYLGADGSEVKPCHMCECDEPCDCLRAWCRYTKAETPRWLFGE
jgi:hypothetical protein